MAAISNSANLTCHERNPATALLLSSRWLLLLSIQFSWEWYLLTGYVYAVFESDKQVKALLRQCSRDQQHDSDSGYYYRVSSKRMKMIQVIPWIQSDDSCSYMMQCGQCCAQRLDIDKTIFVGALHGMLKAEGLARIMNDLFGDVLYTGLDTDKYKYPIG